MKNKLILAVGGLSLLVVLGLVAWMQRSADLPAVIVYKTPTCGCCSKWVDHMRAAGFDVETHDLADLSSTKAQYGVQLEFSSCHTAVVGGYVVEGHVPAEHVKRLLAERPEVAGLTVPGMPMGSPGMEGAYSESYDVLTFDKDGNTSVFAHVEAF
jgi:hypothetical protein